MTRHTIIVFKRSLRIKLLLSRLIIIKSGLVYNKCSDKPGMQSLFCFKRERDGIFLRDPSSNVLIPANWSAEATHVGAIYSERGNH